MVGAEHICTGQWRTRCWDLGQFSLPGLCDLSFRHGVRTLKTKEECELNYRQTQIFNLSITLKFPRFSSPVFLVAHLKREMEGKKGRQKK